MADNRCWRQTWMGNGGLWQLLAGVAVAYGGVLCGVAACGISERMALWRQQPTGC